MKNEKVKIKKQNLKIRCPGQGYVAGLCLIVTLFFCVGASGFVSAGNVPPGGLCCQDGDCAGAGMKCKCDPSGSDTEHPCARDAASGEIKSGKPGICAPADKEVICPFSSHMSLEILLKEVTKYLFWLALAVCPLLIIVGAVYYMFSAGDPGKTKKGRDLIKWALIGLAVMLLARFFFEVIRFIIVAP